MLQAACAFVSQEGASLAHFFPHCPHLHSFQSSDVEGSDVEDADASIPQHPEPSVAHRKPGSNTEN